MKFDTRSFTGVDLRAADGGKKVAGYAARYGVETIIAGCFIEVIRPGAFRKAISRDDVRALINHDASLLLGRTKSGTLRLEEDSRGLKFDVDPPATNYARDLAVSMERGDLDECSFAFGVEVEEWDFESRELPVRTLIDLRLYDVSVVTYPAYAETSAALRSFELAKAEKPAIAVTAGDAIRARLRMKAALAERERGIPRP